MVRRDPTDAELLADWLELHAETAFHSLVDRYGSLVHMAAMRICGNTLLAAEASQLTFITLANKAKSLVSRTSLAGWLHLTAVLHAKNLLRQNRREGRKLQFLRTHMETRTQGVLPVTETWDLIQPVLDEALAALSAGDREALLLRFYRSLTIREIATSLGITIDAAQKRSTRALDHLRRQLARRGCEVGESLSAVMLSNFVTDPQEVTVPESSTLVAKALAASSTAGGISLRTFIAILMTKKTTITGAIALILAAAVSIALIRNKPAVTLSASGMVTGKPGGSPVTTFTPSSDPAAHSTRAHRAFEHPELVAQYGESRTKLSKQINTHLIGLLEDGNVMRELAICGKMPSPFGVKNGTKISQGRLGDELKLTPEQQTFAANSYAEFQKRELVRSKENIERLRQNPVALMQLTLGNDALVRGKITREEYQQLQAVSSHTLKGIGNPLDQKIFGADPPLRDDVFINELKTVLNQEQTETLQSMIEESLAKTKPSSSHAEDIANLPLMELEKLDQTVESARKMTAGFKSLFEGMGDLKNLGSGSGPP